LIVHARTRELAVARMRRALESMVIEGIKTTIPLHLKIMDDPQFQSGNFSTKFLEEFFARQNSTGDVRIANA
jgi:acetyl-CoA carboxylase biotin carboxylase subunit